MMSQRDSLAANALASALRVRKKMGIAFEESLSSIDIAERMGIEVRLIDIPSMEGIYVAGSSPKIILSSLRFAGRRNFTCAHEIGHHVFGHGEQFDELVTDKSNVRARDPKEFSADCFAAYLLMPKATVENGLMKRGFNYQSLDPMQAYILASWLGVSYSALVSHMFLGLRMISIEKARGLWAVDLREIRSNFLEGASSSQLYVIDAYWKGRAIDCEVGDHLLFPPSTVFEGAPLTKLTNISDKLVFQALKPGIARVVNSALGWAAFVRVSRRGYVGRSCFRYEEESIE